MQSKNPNLIAIGIGLISLACLGSCSEEDNVFLRPDPEVVVHLAPSLEPAVGIKVVVMDPSTNLPVAGPVQSDADGRCIFLDLPEGLYRPVAFGGADYLVVSDNEGLRVDHQSATAVIMMGLRREPGGLPRISGQVVDALTGEPLQAAFVSISPTLSGYSGGTTYKDDVTLADGRFTVSEIAIALDPVWGRLVQVEPLLVTCAGYRPISWTHQFGNGDDSVDISGVTIALEPTQAQDTGVLTGRLLIDGEPAYGVVVGLGGKVSQKSAVGQPGYAAVSNQDGVFRFSGLPAGVYLVHPGFLPWDSFVFPNQAGNVGRTVMPEQETNAGDLFLIHEIQLEYPPNGGSFIGPESMEALQWTPVPGAAGYVVYLDRGVVGETDTTSIDIPNDWTLNSGSHNWAVVARDDQDQVVGTTEVGGIFYITPAP